MTKQQAKTPPKSNRKLKYPSIALNINELKSFNNRKSAKQEKVGVVQLLDFVCAQEEETIRKFFDSAQASDIPNPIPMRDSLIAILHSLPQQAQSEGANSIDFEPELPKKERKALLRKRKRLDELKELSQLLKSYESHPDLLREASGLWLGKVPKLPATFEKSEPVVQIADMFKNALDSMNDECNQILQFADNCKKEVTYAKALQDNLYDAFNSAKQGTESSAAVPRDPKEMVRTMNKLLLR